MLTEWSIFIGTIALLFSPLFVRIAFDETNPKGSFRAAVCAVVCASILPTLLLVLV